MSAAIGDCALAASGERRAGPVTENCSALSSFRTVQTRLMAPAASDLSTGPRRTYDEEKRDCDRKWIAVTAVLLAAPMADAAPKNGNEFSVTCPGLGTFDIVTPGNGAFTPAFGEGRVFIPYRVTGTVTVNGQVVQEFDDIKAAPVPSSAIACTSRPSSRMRGASSWSTGPLSLCRGADDESPPGELVKHGASVHWWRPSGGRRCHRTGSSRPDVSRTG